MDRRELVEAIEDLEHRLDVASHPEVDDIYNELMDSLATLKRMLGKRIL